MRTWQRRRGGVRLGTTCGRPLRVGKPSTCPRRFGIASSQRQMPATPSGRYLATLSAGGRKEGVAALKRTEVNQRKPQSARSSKRIPQPAPPRNPQRKMKEEEGRVTFSRAGRKGQADAGVFRSPYRQGQNKNRTPRKVSKSGGPEPHASAEAAKHGLCNEFLSR